jgi:hypothetical protein
MLRPIVVSHNVAGNREAAPLGAWGRRFESGRPDTVSLETGNRSVRVSGAHCCRDCAGHSPVMQSPVLSARSPTAERLFYEPL